MPGEHLTAADDGSATEAVASEGMLLPVTSPGDRQKPALLESDVVLEAGVASCWAAGLSAK